MKKEELRKTVKFANAFIAIAMIALLAYGLINLSNLDEKVSQEIYDYGAPALFIISLLLDLVPQLISPIIALGTAIIAGVNPQYAIIATILGSLIGSLIGFFLGKKYMFDAVYVLLSKESAEKLTKITNKYGKAIVPLAAISPLPYLPVLLGAMNLSNKNFWVYGLIPRALAIIVYGYLASTF
jgi:membrane protein YqaA with SNARE-associated domain